MWPFGSAGSPSAPAVTMHPTENRPLTNSECANPQLNPKNPEGLKPCCACPETKKLRDDCFLKYGSNADDGADSENACKAIVENHLKCMRSLGFNM